MSLWAFRFLLWYICVLLIQPQNRFTFMYSWHIADLAIMLSLGCHTVSCLQENRPIVRFGPATILATMLLAAGFLSQRAGTFQISPAWNGYIDRLAKGALVLIMVEAMATSVQRVWALLATMMLAVLWWLKGGIRLALSGATYSGDRIMGPAVSLIDNPNGFAYMLCVMIPLYLLFYQQSKLIYIKAAFLTCALLAVYIVLETGSRTGMMILLALSAVLLPKYGARHKMALIVGGVVIFFLFSIVSPGNIARLKTIPKSLKAALSGEVKDFGELDQDQQSAQERSMKNRQTWALIKRYPLFGVGINPDGSKYGQEFPMARGQVHCEILMAGRQMGIVGMGLYVGFIATMLALGLRVQRGMAARWPYVSDIGWTLKVQAVTIIFGGAFSPLPWNAVTLMLAGCASALWSNLEEMGMVSARGAAAGANNGTRAVPAGV